MLVVIPTPDGFDARAKSIAPEIEIVHSRPGDGGYEEALMASSIVLGRPPVDDVGRSRATEWLQLSSAGANQYVGKIPEHVTLTTASGVYGIPAAEHALAMMLAHARSIPKHVRDQSGRRWSRDGTHRELHGSTCGVLGLGDIGTAVARRARAFGMRILAVRRNPGDKPEWIEKLFPPDRTDEMLAQCDYVVNTLPATGATRKMIDGRRLKTMKQGSFLCNVGRGSTVDETALVEALHEGRLSGAGLDVFEEEPLSVESPLWEMENVIITPHVGGSSPREDERVADLFFENLERFVRGEELINRVDPGLGY